MPDATHKPVVPASQKMAEATPRAIVLGILLALLMAAANLYLGLYAGTTISASIPAAVISMGILRGILKRGTILENNLIQTMAASGEAIASGIVYTLPALLIAGVWQHVDFWTTTLVCFVGGILGVIFMIPLRQSHVVNDTTLSYPEGVACAEVLKAGDKGGSQAKYVLYSLLLSALTKFFTSGVLLFKSSVEWAFPVGKTAFFIGSDISPALIGVGYIVGFNISLLIGIGGILAWCVAIPIVGLRHGVQGIPLDWYWSVWSDEVRYLGVGAMMVGGVASIWEVRHSFAAGCSEVFKGWKKKSDSKAILRTDLNMSGGSMAFLFVLSGVLMVLLYQKLLGNWPASLLTSAIATGVCFFYVAVGSYIVGMVGSSNSPVSGITISTVLLTGALLSVAKISGTQGLLATLGVAGVVCCAVSSAGEMSQDLKTGYLVGATPRAQQWGQVVGVGIACLLMAPVITILHESYGIGTGKPGSLKAPQATLFANLAKAIFADAHLPWDIVAIGAGIGIVILAMDTVLAKRKASFRLPLMAAAVGMYLPFTLVIPSLVGGILQHVCRHKRGTSQAVLFSSGFVAGESIMGILLGTVMYFNPSVFPIPVLSSDTLSLAVVAISGYLLWRVAQSKPA